jgi:hypothetical protein
VIRNATVMDAAVISTNTGDTVCLDRHDDATGGFQFADHEGCAPPEWDEARRKPAEHGARHPLRARRPGAGAAAGRGAGPVMFGDDNDGISPSRPAREPRVRRAGAGRRRVDERLVLPRRAGARGTGTRRDGRRSGRGRTRGAKAVVATAAMTLLVVPLGLWGSTRFHVPLLPFLAIGAGAALTPPVGGVASAPRPTRTTSRWTGGPSRTESRTESTGTLQVRRSRRRAGRGVTSPR